MSYQEDTTDKVYDSLVKLESEIIAASASLKGLGEQEANAVSLYENCKNGCLIELYAEESSPDFKGKRTEATRTAMYRKRFEIERLEKALAAHNLKAEQDYLKAMLAVLSSMQSRMRVLENERKISEQVR